MIRITALYPNISGKRFDAAYYIDRHAPFARALLTPHGLRELRVTIGLATLDGDPPPFCSVSELVFDDRGAFDAAIARCGEELFADLPNYTDITPQLQISELRGVDPAEGDA